MFFKKFIDGPGIDEPICMIDVAGGNALYYYHFDGLGSVVALSNNVGTLVEQYSYDVFGTPSATSSISNPYMFTGRRFDTESGLYYYRARYYKPSIGRFLQTDPIGYEDSMNLYQYCGNDPVNWIDPSGLYGRKDGSIDIANVTYITSDDVKQNITVASAATIKDIIKQAEISGNKITFFEYTGHAYPEGLGLAIGPEGGGIIVGGAGGSYGDTITYQDLESSIQKAFSPDATIQLQGCQTAAGNNSIAAAFKRTFPDATVIGFTGDALKIPLIGEAIPNFWPWGKYGWWKEMENPGAKLPDKPKK